MLNAIGLQGIGVHRFIQEKMPELRERGAVVLVNICGTTLEEYVELARILSDVDGVAALELNISCPNIKEGGITFGCSLTGTFDVVHAVRQVTRLPVIPKLTPNVTDVASFARAADEAGADAVSLVNTFLAMVIDIETRRPKLSNIVGGLSGPAIRPIAVRMVYECHRAVKIPVLGMGGIASARDALEFMIAGASAVQVGTANFEDPFIWPKLLAGITDYMERIGSPASPIWSGRSMPADARKNGSAPSCPRRQHGRGSRTADRTVGRHRRWVQGWQSPVHCRRTRVRPASHGPRHSRGSGSQVARHPEHGGGGSGGGNSTRRLDDDDPQLWWSRHDAGGGARCSRYGVKSGIASPHVVAVTLLTSLDAASRSRSWDLRDVPAQVEAMATLADRRGLTASSPLP